MQRQTYMYPYTYTQGITALQVYTKKTPTNKPHTQKMLPSVDLLQDVLLSQNFILLIHKHIRNL